MMTETSMIAILSLAYIITSGVAFWFLVADYLRFRRTLRHYNYLTNGDVAFCLFIAIIPIVGPVVAVIVYLTESHGNDVEGWQSRRSWLDKR